MKEKKTVFSCALRVLKQNLSVLFDINVIYILEKITIKVYSIYY